DRMDGYTISRLPLIQTPEQRKALALYREASFTNVVWLSFLFYWQILEIGGGRSPEVVKEIERSQPSAQSHERTELARLLGVQTPLRGAALADYLEDDCRHAIAHIRRYPGRRVLAFDSLRDDRRMAVSTGVAKSLAEHFIRHQLALTGRLNLARPRSGGFPKYVDLRSVHRRDWTALPG
ncbi:MAG: hypothetical protein KBH14_15970, partial [Vicinamibacteria bacterium]|nr:hypothetical protein [Vicinamibacteria bacterium]